MSVHLTCLAKRETGLHLFEAAVVLCYSYHVTVVGATASACYLGSAKLRVCNRNERARLLIKFCDCGRRGFDLL
jgi:hypothetical protein